MDHGKHRCCYSFVGFQEKVSRHWGHDDPAWKRGEGVNPGRLLQCPEINGSDGSSPPLRAVRPRTDLGLLWARRWLVPRIQKCKGAVCALEEPTAAGVGIPRHLKAKVKAAHPAPAHQASLASESSTHLPVPWVLLSQMRPQTPTPTPRPSCRALRPHRHTVATKGKTIECSERTPAWLPGLYSAHKVQPPPSHTPRSPGAPRGRQDGRDGPLKTLQWLSCSAERAWTSLRGRGLHSTLGPPLPFLVLITPLALGLCAGPSA